VSILEKESRASYSTIVTPVVTPTVSFKLNMQPPYNPVLPPWALIAQNKQFMFTQKLTHECS
jgi:hypothetical protein